MSLFADELVDARLSQAEATALECMVKLGANKLAVLRLIVQARHGRGSRATSDE